MQLQRAMAAEAEAAREARAKVPRSFKYLSFVTSQVIAAEGEQKASKALKEAADVLQQSPSALQLRYLQTLNSISAGRGLQQEEDTLYMTSFQSTTPPSSSPCPSTWPAWAPQPTPSPRSRSETISLLPSVLVNTLWNKMEVRKSISDHLSIP